MATLQEFVTFGITPEAAMKKMVNEIVNYKDEQAKKHGAYLKELHISHTINEFNPKAAPHFKEGFFATALVQFVKVISKSH